MMCISLGYRARSARGLDGSRSISFLSSPLRDAYPYFPHSRDANSAIPSRWLFELIIYCTLYVRTLDYQRTRMNHEPRYSGGTLFPSAVTSAVSTG